MPNKLFAVRDFNDVGTGKSFKQGAEITASEGELANYEAAGLTTETDPQAPQATLAPPVTANVTPSPQAPVVGGKHGSLTA